MIVQSLSPRKRFLCAVALLPPPDPQEFEADYEGERLLLDRRILERCGVVVGLQLNDEDLTTLIKTSECYRAKQRAIWYLSRSDCCSKGLYNKLRRYFKEYAAEFAVKQMNDLGYLNDRDYAHRLADSLLTYGGLSIRAARGKMLQKGVEKTLADEVLEDFDVNSKELILKLIDKKYKNKLSDEDDKRRTIAALQRRGFSFSDIRSALLELRKEVDFYD